ncbi:histone-lysine N-methyltransferase SETMAR-like [Octopus sinensis]|uniref:Histone-lysine N-methyltransferase SETMAR-like n=1 Tax=Octopus sinensis TaxID=2607531 RepID=A0A6P7U9D6_9MOLL|nr:histone-lysine N-methyltransferase SETMAR-like [Octopus sinensis]
MQKRTFSPYSTFLFPQRQRKRLRFRKEKCEVYGIDYLIERISQKWLLKFLSGDFSLKDEQCSGSSTKVDDRIKAIIETACHITVREIAERLNLSHTIENYLKCLGFVKKFDIYAPHKLKAIHFTQHINICDMHLLRNEIDLF